MEGRNFCFADSKIVKKAASFLTADSNQVEERGRRNNSVANYFVLVIVAVKMVNVLAGKVLKRLKINAQKVKTG